MADRIPLIINSTAQQIQELPSGDNLTGITNIEATGNITGVTDITASGTVTGNTLVGVGAVPIGCVIMWAGSPSSIPTGYLLCDGTAINRTGTYAPLFAGIGTAYGEGNGSTTFNVPALVNRYVYGAGTGGSDPKPGDGENLGQVGGSALVSFAINFIIRAV
jgi:hypothetical protein